TPSLYAPQQSADPKFSRPVADTTRTMTVISEQVIKDQGATNLTDARISDRQIVVAHKAKALMLRQPA
ncbi:hypothetical protein ACUOFC_68915, partial [Escherichia sp. TWPC-MK]